MMNRGLAVTVALATAGFALGACADAKPAADGGAGFDATADVRDAVADVHFALPDVVDGVPDDRPPLPGVTCVTKHSVPRDGGFCSQTLTTEPDVGFWRAMINLESHWDAALRTDAEGIHRFFGTTTSASQRPQFYATDDTFTLYRAREMVVPGMDTGTVRRTGDRLDFTMNARRGDVAGGCTVPGVEITCSGSTWLRQ
jgi:hypothetical protein